MLRQPQDKREALRLYQALNAFGHSEAGKIILKYLESEKNRLQDLNDNEDEEYKFRQVQGVNKLLRKFISMAINSNEEVKKLT